MERNIKIKVISQVKNVALSDADVEQYASDLRRKINEALSINNKLDEVEHRIPETENYSDKNTFRVMRTLIIGYGQERYKATVYRTNPQIFLHDIDQREISGEYRLELIK